MNPWRGLFLLARARGIQCSLAEGESPESIARAYSMDPGQVRLIGATDQSTMIVPDGEIQELLQHVGRAGGIDDLINRSSLGTPEAMATRAQADPAIVRRALRRADGLAKIPDAKVTK